MTTHFGAFVALLLLAPLAPAQTLRARPRPQGVPPPPPVEDASVNGLVEFWASMYGYRSDPPPASEGGSGSNPFQFELLAKAPKDECFIAIGQHTQMMPPNCPPGSTEKANELYLWGMAMQQGAGDGDDEAVWFGIGANTPCLANGSLGGLVEPSQDAATVCEYGESRLVEQIPIWPAGLGDYRPPRMLRLLVDGQTGDSTLEDLTPQLDFIAEFQRQTTAGIRAVGIADNVVLFAGPALTLIGTINLFAFRTDGSFIGSQGFDQWADVRKFLNVDGELYMGVSNSIINDFPGGTVLHWIGDETNPFAFEVVGRLNNEVAELTAYEDTTSGAPVKRIVAGTWPRLYGPFGRTDELYGLFESPPLPIGPGSAFGWNQLFRIDQYEPDPVTARALASGAVIAHDGWIWFGTLITIGIPVLAWVEQYGIPLTPDKINQVVLGTYRPLTFFRGRKVNGPFGPTFEVQVLYGSPELPVYNFFLGDFFPQPNGIEPPRSGLGGFDNFYNTYTWSAEVGSDGLLYVGTLDNSFSLFGIEMLPNQPEQAVDLIAERNFGADLWVFGPGQPKARPVMTRGFGNDTNSGVRNLVSGQTGLYAGTGNVSNLLPEGGWELVRVLSPLMQN
jgi:hypothetical protein